MGLLYDETILDTGLFSCTDTVLLTEASLENAQTFRLVLQPVCSVPALYTGFLLPAQAANTVTVQGKVMSGTTGSLLLLDTPQGKMEIKIDNATDTTAGKILLPDQAISVTVTGGSDGYLHATKISTGNQIGNGL